MSPIPEPDSPYDPQWVQDLKAQYPQITRSPWMFTVEVGWKDLVTKLIEDVVRVHPGIKIVQVKEKFGGLRFYYESLKDEPEEVYTAVWALVQKAEAESYTICEDCGAEGELRKRGWWRTLCGPCHKVWLESREKQDAIE